MRADRGGGGEVDDVGAPVAQHAAQSRGGQADTEVAVARQAHGRAPDDLRRPVVVGRLVTVGAAGGVDDDLVATGVEVVAHPENTVGHAVDLGQERLGYHCDSHVLQD